MAEESKAAWYGIRNCHYMYHWRKSRSNGIRKQKDRINLDVGKNKEKRCETVPAGVKQHKKHKDMFLIYMVKAGKRLYCLGLQRRETCIESLERP